MELGREQKNFYLILCAILLAHAAFLVMKKIELASEFDNVPEEKIFKVKFLPPPEDVLKATATLAPKQQIVQTDQQSEKIKPKVPAFLGESDQSYDRETVAAKVDVFNQAGKGARTGADSTRIEKTAAAKPAPKTQKKEISLSDLGLKQENPFENFQKEKAALAAQGLENGNEKNRGVSSTNDYIEHKQLGDFTQLNTVEFKYYGFYHRIRQKLEQFWGQSLHAKADKIFKSGRRIASDEDHITALLVTLNNKGEIVHVKVKAASGVQELDDAAIESFNKAGPFPNPPAGMLENGYATIEWGFVVKT